MAKKNVTTKEERKESANQVAEQKKALEGLTKQTVESGVISFKEGSGSQDLLNLIVEHGFNREKVIAAAQKLREKGKAFLKSDPEKKYNKVAGIIKRLQNANYKMPKAS